MENQRVKCKTEGCENMILPATARANEGHCMPCVQKRRREEREDYIRRNRREVDPYAGIKDVVEIIRVMHTRRPDDPLVVYRPAPKSAEELYSALNAEQAARLMRMAAEAIRARDNEFAEDVAKSLATLTDFPLDEMLKAWVECDCFWPPVIFRGAGPKITDAVIEAGSKREEYRHALCALAWIGDARAQSFFREWKGHPLSLRPEIIIGSKTYTHDAAWEVEGNGRRDLFHPECWAMTTTADNARDTAVGVMGEADASCSWCKRRLVHLIELDLTDERFRFLNFAGKTLIILTCEVCTCFGFVFSRISSDGIARVDQSERPRGLPKDSSSWRTNPWKGQAVRLHRRRAIHAVDWVMPVTLSQIGGLPSWVQGAEFPKCPDCSRTMTFIAQLDNGHFPSDEGVYYAFLCAQCRTAATTYQQS